MSTLTLSRLISRGMVLQRDKKARIWGHDVPGRDISVLFRDDVYMTVTDSDGYFELWLNPSPYGGPFTMEISDDAGERIIIEDVLVGEVWLCSGQSNMELPMARVKDMYPEDLIDCDYPMVRSFKIKEDIDFTGPVDDMRTGEWIRPSKENIEEFSAVGYYFARELNKMTGIPVGFIDASLGGSLIHCWISREMLKGYDDKLALADKYADDEFRASVLKANEEKPMAWHKEFDGKDLGLKEHWEGDDINDDSWDRVILPAFFRDTSIGNILGCIYFRRSFDVPKGLAGREASLWLGTIVDSDTTYINGVKVGNTEYQYPPRKYNIPSGLLREGRNTITVRVKIEYYLEFMPGKVSGGRFTPGKEYKIFNDEYSVDLSGEWKYRAGVVAGNEAPRQDFVSWKPSGLYNAMTAPCHRYTIGGVNWYQGESDCELVGDYPDLFDRMVKGYRKEWNDDKLRFDVVQLPNFTIDNDPDSEAWTFMRETLRTISDRTDHCDSVVTIDLGEDNDLHPQRKREIGRRLALLAARYACDADVVCFGPVIKKFMCVKKNDTAEITLNMDHTGEGLEARSANGKGSDGKVTDFIVVDDAGNKYETDVTVMKDKIVLNVASLNRSVKEIRYCYSQTNSGSLIYNSEGLPMSPGIYKI